MKSLVTKFLYITETCTSDKKKGFKDWEEDKTHKKIREIRSVVFSPNFFVRRYPNLSRLYSQSWTEHIIIHGGDDYTWITPVPPSSCIAYITYCLDTEVVRGKVLKGTDLPLSTSLVLLTSYLPKSTK